MSTEELKRDLDAMLSAYLAVNPAIKSQSKTHELEVRFGTGKKQKISKTDYDNVIMKLMSCGFVCDNKEGITMLRINTEEVDKITGQIKMSNVRAELVGSELVQQYCRTNSIKKLIDMPVDNTYKMKFTQKSSARKASGEPIQKVVFADFNFNVSFNVETDYAVDSKHVADLVRNWADVRKTFRLINRVRFYKDDSPIAVDLSIIRTSAMSGGVMVPTHTMEESGVFKSQGHCEIELEIVNEKVGLGTVYTPAAVKTLSDELRRVIRIVLSGLQDTQFPVSYKEQDTVIQNYMRLIHGDTYEPRRVTGRDFIGPSSLTLQLKNVIKPDADSVEPNVRNNYCVTEKADGDRKLLYIDGTDGKIYLINTNMLVQFTGCIASDKTVWNTLLDGEHIKFNAKREFINMYAAFDAYHIAGKSVREHWFAPLSRDMMDGKRQFRLQLLNKVVQTMKAVSVVKQGPPSMNIVAKKFYPASDGRSIFDACNTVLIDVNDGVYPYNTDGLILTPMDAGVGGIPGRDGHTAKLEKNTWIHSFKWKPPAFNTIDFLVTYNLDKDGKDRVHNVFGGSQYRTLVLRCGFDKNTHGFINPFQDMLDDKIPAPSKGWDDEDRYVPMPFQPTNPADAEAHLCNVNVVDGAMYTEEGERFDENTIVEFSYDKSAEQGWRWKPLRVRHDKTFNLRSGNKEYGNAYHVANDNWKSIHHPVTEHMMRTGQDIPDADATDDVYYNKGKNDQVSYTRALRNFHNLFVKRKLIEGVSRTNAAGKKTLIDYAVGKAGDLSKWKYAGLRFVFGIDVSKDNIFNQLNGACARYLSEKSKTPRLFDAIFLPGNSGLNIRDGTAFFSPKEAAISDAVFGRGSKDSTKMGTAVYRNYGIGEKGFNVSSCQFALHYFFENGTVFHNFLRNLSECTAAGGHFIATCYDGATVFRMLQNKTNEAIYVNGGKDKIFEIQKMYDFTGFPDDETSLGYAINVYQESINKYAVEYLVNYEFFIRSMENYGFVLVSDEEARDFGFEKGSAMFGTLFSMMEKELARNPAAKNWYEDAVRMTPEEKRISFLNRYYIFKKTHNVNASKVEKIVAISEAEVEKELLKEEKRVEKEAAKVEAKESAAAAAAAAAAPIKEKKPRAKKIKSAEKLQITDFDPMEDKPPAKDTMDMGEVTVAAEVVEQPRVPEEPALTAVVKDDSGNAEVKGVAVGAKERCPKGTKRYAPVGPNCYTQEEIDAWQAARKARQTKKK